MPVKTLTVHSCSSCYFAMYDTSTGWNLCQLNECKPTWDDIKTLSPNEIPSWCPLRDGHVEIKLDKKA